MSTEPKCPNCDRAECCSVAAGVAYHRAASVVSSSLEVIDGKRLIDWEREAAAARRECHRHAIDWRSEAVNLRAQLATATAALASERAAREAAERLVSEERTHAAAMVDALRRRWHAESCPCGDCRDKRKALAAHAARRP